MRSLFKLRPFFLRPHATRLPTGSSKVFLLMSNARAGSSYFQSAISALGATGDFEFALRPYGTQMPHQRFLSLGIDDIAGEIRNSVGTEHSMCGSKLTLPLHDYLSTDEVFQLLRACSNVSSPIHLVRHYWDLLKSNLSRGVAHDFNSRGNGWSDSSQMHKAYANLPSVELGPEKPSVFVGLSEEAFRKYLLNLIRNDFVFSSIRETGKGITVTYESLQTIEVFKQVLDYLGIKSSDSDIRRVIENPLLKKLPLIPDSNIPYEQLLQEVTESCYRFYLDSDEHKRTAKQIFDAQLIEIKRAFG